tara:strand:- start:1047 stop:1331 length:285 start_codon:yes stop_codon:yes gene_type:complete
MDNSKYENLYRHEVYLGDYRIEWSDQKITIVCVCQDRTELELFSESPTICPKCSRKYSIMEIVKVEVPEELADDQNYSDVDIDEIIEHDRRKWE